jgi:hypothetical protein
VSGFRGEKFGRLVPGYVGSLTVLDLRRPTTVRREDLRTLCGWSPFEGITFPYAAADVDTARARVREEAGLRTALLQGRLAMGPHDRWATL